MQLNSFAKSIMEVDHETNTDVSPHPLNDAECKYTLGFYVLYWVSKESKLIVE